MPSVNSTQSLYKNRNLHIVFGVTLMAVLGVASITPAFPKILTHFKLSPQSAGLLITFFTIPGIILTPVTGVLADRWGRRKILIPSLVLFGIAGGSCAFAGSFETLLILRVLQGIGAASLGSLNATLIGDLFPGKQRAAAMGYNASILSIGTASYPVIGGGLAVFGWNYPFLLPLLAIPLGIITLLFFKNPEPQRKQNLFGYLRNTFKQIKKKDALILFFLSAVTFIILYGSYLTFFPILMSTRFLNNTFIIGLIMSTSSLATAITSAQLGRLNVKYKQNNLIKTSFIFYAISLTAIPYSPNIFYLILPVLLFGVAQGLNIPTVQTMLTSLAPLENRAAFMSVNGMVLRFGQTSGPLIIGFVYGLGGLDAAFFSGALISFLTFVLILRIMR